MKNSIFTKLLSIALVCVMSVMCMGVYRVPKHEKLYYVSNYMGANLVDDATKSSNKNALDPRFGQNLVLELTETKMSGMANILSTFILEIKSIEFP